MNIFINNNNVSKKKVLFVTGETGSEKTHLSIDFPTHFLGENINSEKMQVFKGLDIVTNKIPHTKKQGVSNYMLGLEDQLRQLFVPDVDYTKEIRRSIGVPEMDQYLREETNLDKDDESKMLIHQSSIKDIKNNICTLIDRQLDKINQLINEKIWLVYHIDAGAFDEAKKEGIDEAWKNDILEPCLQAAENFVFNFHDMMSNEG